MRKLPKWDLKLGVACTGRKKNINKDKNYEEFSIEDLLEEIKNLKKELKFLENLLKNKKSSQNNADKLFEK